MTKNELSLIKETSSLDELSSSDYAKIIKFLIVNEKAPGGPYIITHSNDDYELNYKIYSLFAEKGKILNGALQYALDHGLMDKAKDNQDKVGKSAENISSKSWEGIYQNINEEYKSNDIFTYLFKKLKSTDKSGEISKLSEIFYNSCKPYLKDKFTVTSLKLKSLSTANQYAWLAYTLYDQILDESNNTSLLPIANMAQRQSLKYYVDAKIDLTFLLEKYSFVDESNFIELKDRMCLNVNLEKNTINIKKIPSIDIARSLLYGRSMIHVLGPMFISTCFSPARSETIEDALRMYCLARQLNDDIHDWVEDLESGRMTYVVIDLLKNMNTKAGEYNLTNFIDQARKYFWNNELTKLCDEVSMNINMAITILEKEILSDESEFVTQFLLPLSLSAEMVKKSHEFNQGFLQNYKL